MGCCEVNILFLETVCPQTESTLYTDSFFERQDIMVNALDNVEARRYMDRYAMLYNITDCNFCV